MANSIAATIKKKEKTFVKSAKRLLGVNGVRRRLAGRKAEWDQGSNSLAAPGLLLFGGAALKTSVRRGDAASYLNYRGSG